jgi:hypothetical protein
MSLKSWLQGAWQDILSGFHWFQKNGEPIVALGAAIAPKVSSDPKVAAGVNIANSVMTALDAAVTIADKHEAGTEVTKEDLNGLVKAVKDTKAVVETNVAEIKK